MRNRRPLGTIAVIFGFLTAYSVAPAALAGPLQDIAALQPGEWYELWYVVNNTRRETGGQRYDVYLRGGEFETQQLVFEAADFRMRRTLPLTYFMAISNTGPHDAPYGNGGVRYDDIYMAAGRNLVSALK